MQYPKIVEAGKISDLNENIVRFLRKYRGQIMKSRSSDPVQNVFKDDRACVDIQTHQLTLNLTFWFWVNDEKIEAIIKESTLKFASFNEAFGQPEPVLPDDWKEHELIEQEPEPNKIELS